MKSKQLVQAKKRKEKQNSSIHFLQFKTSSNSIILMSFSNKIIWQHKHMFIFCACLHLCLFLRESLQPSFCTEKQSCKRPTRQLMDRSNTDTCSNNLSVYTCSLCFETQTAWGWWFGEASVVLNIMRQLLIDFDRYSYDRYSYNHFMFTGHTKILNPFM